MGANGYCRSSLPAVDKGVMISQMSSSQDSLCARLADACETIQHMKMEYRLSKPERF